MKSIIALGLVLFAGSAQAAALSTNQIYQLNNQAGPVFRAIQLGTKLNTIDTAPAIASSGVSSAMIAANAVTEAKLVDPATTGRNVERVAHAVWDPSGDTTMRTVAAHGLGVTIPANAIITQSWFHTKTSVVSTSNDGTIAFSCINANDILSAADIDSSSGVAGQIASGVSTGTAANMKLNGSSACEITATVAVHAFTAGKIDVFVRYVVSE